MSRIRKPTGDQEFAMSCDNVTYELSLVAGERPYLWLGEYHADGQRHVTTFSGKAALRKFRDALTKALR